jgi:putative transposase
LLPFVSPTISTTNILRAGARQLLALAVEIEVETFLATVKDLKLADGRARVVRHG